MTPLNNSSTTPRQSHSWGPTVIAAGVLSIVGMGDVLLYVVLPVNAETFGVNIFWVGVLLAANRLVRIACYGPVASIMQRYGPRNIAIIAHIIGLA